jgi:DNA-binding response OmpR family regulator
MNNMSNEIEVKMATARILIVEDDAEILDLIRTAMSFKEYETVDSMTGGNVLDLAREHRPSLIILDLQLPDMDGLEVCKLLKSDATTRGIPVIMLTARDGVSDIVRGLEAGANDYVTKPFEVMELMARVRAQIRLAGEMKGPPPSIDKDGIHLDLFQRSVTFEGRTIKEFTEKEFEILYYLVWRSPKVLTRKEIFESIWRTVYEGETRTIDVHMQRVRQKLGPSLARRILSVKGQGYKFV